MAATDPNTGRPVIHGDTAIELRGVVKRYGSTVAVNDLSFRVERGDFFGFIGANGAGKSSTLRILATFLTPDAGHARVFGHDVAAEAQTVRHLIGYMPDHLGLHREMKAAEYLQFFASAYSIPEDRRPILVSEALDRVRLADRRQAVIGTLSRGMQQRLALARALIHDPPLLLLDEPASGLDPRARAEMMSLLDELRRAGKTIFLSSHILGDLQDHCNRLAILDRGRLMFCGTLEELRRDIQRARQFYIEVADRAEEARAVLGDRKEIVSIEPAGRGLQVRLQAGVTDPAFIANCLVQRGFKLVALRERTAALEEMFLRLTGEREA